MNDMPLNVKVLVLRAFLEAYGWVRKNTEGDHHHFVYPLRRGKVTLVGKDSDDTSAELLASILRQAGVTQKELRKWLNR
jgi:predicted RNA binding protein YcfA (HicA-like mRNA interferase family)